MYVAVRQRSHAAWVVVDEHAPTPEETSFAPVAAIGEIGELVPAFPTALESFELEEMRVLDLVGVDARGRITLGLCRIGPEAGVTRLCVARLLELAAIVRRERPFEELERRIELLHGVSVLELVQRRLGPGTEIDGRAFLLRFAADAADGRFRLTLSSLAVSHELDAVLDIVDDPTDRILEFAPVEMAAFDFGAWGVGMPRVKREVLPGADGEIETGGVDAPGESGSVIGRDLSFGDDDAWEEVLDTLRDEEPLPFESIDDLERYAEELERSAHDDLLVDPSYEYGDLDGGEPEPPEVVLSVSGRRHDEDGFFASLLERTTRTTVQRAQRLLELGREPARTLPAGWIVSPEALSFQAGVLRERIHPPEPVVAEILRLDTRGRLTMDLPLLRVLLSEEAIDAFLRDLGTTNPLLRIALGPANERSKLGLDDVFDSDFDVRSFCVAVRKLVLGIHSNGESGGREAA